MRSAGYTAQEMIEGGYRIESLRVDANYTAKELKLWNLEIALLREGGYTPSDMLEARYTAKEL